MVAIQTGDWHLSDTPPAYRENEPDWWAAQQRPLDQIKELQNKYHGVPILFGGDLFDKAKCSPELVNWTIKHMPQVYGIPGNHDLVHHRYEDIHKSSFWTMVEASKVIDLKPGVPHPLHGFTVYGYPFGSPVKSVASHPIVGFNVAVVHAYCWRKGHGFPGATPEHRVTEWEKKLGNFQIACFADNHSHFVYGGKETTVVNTGCIMRRRRDESGYEPRVALIWSDGEVSFKKLDCSEDQYVTDEGTAVERGQEIDVGSLMGSLARLKTTRIDFNDAVNGLMETLKVSKDTRQKVMESLDGRKK